MTVLPKFSTPIGTFELIDGRKIAFNYFTKAQEKSLLFAAEVDNITDRIEVISKVVKECTSGKIDPENEPKYVTEAIYLQLRASSISSTVEFSIEQEDDKSIPCVLDISDLEFKQSDEEFQKFVDLSEYIEGDEKVQVEFRIPTIFDYDLPKDDDGSGLLYNCFENIYVGDDVISKNDISKKEFDEWYQTMPMSLSVFQNNIDRIPQVECSLTVGDKTQRLHDIINFLIFK